MKKQQKSKNSAARKKSATNPKSPQTAISQDRRSLLRQVRNGSIIAGVVAGAGWLMVDYVGAVIDEHDLSRIGNGTPTIVQIHDPQCPRCLALQREARSALSDFETGELQYVIANIRTAQGKALASRYGVGHVTLLLFDGKGDMRNVLAGENTRDRLRAEFLAHLAASGSS